MPKEIVARPRLDRRNQHRQWAIPGANVLFQTYGVGIVIHHLSPV